jgi:hypothetical protein
MSPIRRTPSRAAGALVLASTVACTLAGSAPAALAQSASTTSQPPAQTPPIAPSSQPAPAARPSPSASETAPVSIPMHFFGEVRTRSELDRPGGTLDPDAFTYLRSRFGVRVDASPNARVVLQLQDSRVLGAEGNATATAPDAIDLHEGYVQLTAPWRGLSLSARAGRQEIALGNERLVGVVNWSNTGRAFDGLRLTAAPRSGAWEATAFAATVEEKGRRFGAAPPPSSPDHAVAGLFVTRGRATSPTPSGGSPSGGSPSGGSPSAAIVDLTALYDRGAKYRAYDAADRTTIDARVRVPSLLGARAELEAAYQFGVQRFTSSSDSSSHGQSVRAGLLGARLGTPTIAGRWSASVGADWLSGASDPRGERYGAFSTLFASNHAFYGLMDIVGDPSAQTKERGLLDAMATTSVSLGASASLRGELHRLAPASGDRAPLGWEGDVVLPLRLSSAAGIDVGYAFFRAGANAAPLGLGSEGTVRNWAYLQMRVGF